MNSPSTEDPRRPGPADHDELSAAEPAGYAQGRLNTEEEIASLFEPASSSKSGRPSPPNPWPIDSRLDSLSGGNSRVTMDPIGQFVYQEHNSFFRTRMPKATHWSVVWSDLMMTMFIFFVVLFVFFSLHPQGLGNRQIGSDLKSGSGPGKIGASGGGGLGMQSVPAEASADQIFRVSRQTILEHKLNDFAHVDLAPDKSVRIILTGDLLFDPGQTELRSRARQSLASIAGLLRRTPYMINVIGHTDDLPIHTDRFPSNWELSMARAGVVARYLIDEMGLPASRFYVSGRASYQPELRNNSPANRAVNRRVEIVITRDMPEAEYVADPQKMLLPPKPEMEMARVKNPL